MKKPTNEELAKYIDSIQSKIAEDELLELILDLASTTEEEESAEEEIPLDEVEYSAAQLVELAIKGCILDMQHTGGDYKTDHILVHNAETLARTLSILNSIK